MASHISLDEVQNLPDVLSNENFRLQIGEIPGVGDSNALSIKCQTAEIPGRTNQAYEVSLGGFIRTFRGRNRFSNQMAVSFVETIDMDTYLKLRGWLEQIDGLNSGTSIGDIKDYSTSAELSIFDQAGREVEVINFRNFYIDAIQASPLEVQQGQPVQVQASFRYDVMDSKLIQPR